VNKFQLDPGAVKAIAFDLDGTLLQKDKTISGRTKRAVEKCRERGVRLIIATGRALGSGEVYRKQLGLSGPQIYYNGALVVDMPSGRVVSSTFVPVEPIRYCVEIARSLGVYVQVYFPEGALPGHDGEVLMAETLGAESDFYNVSSGVQAVQGDLLEALNSPGVTEIIKTLFISLEHSPQGNEKLNKIRALVTQRFKDGVYVVASQAEYLEVLNSGASKGTGLSRALDYLGIRKENTLVFGDEENDLPLFAQAAWSAAPANARPAVLEAAGFKIAANTEDGVAQFLEALYR
jgi:Cof subfamily protein (haloacid dehalogenase superfamily)